MKYKAVICFSAIDWNLLRQRVHYIMEGLADRGLSVLFIENTGIRNPKFRDLPRLIYRFKNISKSAKEISDMPKSFDIFSPLAVPLPYMYPAVLYNAGYIRKRIRSFLKKHSLTPAEIIFWTYLATPVVQKLAGECPWGCVVYDLVSDPKLIEPRVGLYEKRLLQRADKVLFASHTLCEQYKALTRNPVVFKDGFNLELTSAPQAPCEMDNLPHPRFLYIGGINRKIWPEMLEALSSTYPGGSIVLMGPKDDDARIPVLPNIHILPARERYQELASFLARADAGIIPYYNDRYSGVMHPAKLNEYLIFGLPVVATATPELQKLNSHWGKGFLYLGRDPEDFARAASSALAENNEEAWEGRKTFTRAHTWPARVEELLRMIEEMH